MTLFYILSAIVLAILYAIYYISKRKFNYWKLQNVPYLEPTPIFGNYKDYILMKTFLGEVTKNICLKLPNEPYIGTFYGTEPALLLQCPELIKLITTKDFYYFSSREVSSYVEHEVLTRNMFFTYGDHWRILRQNSTSLFSSAKMKKMFYLIEKCAHQFQDLLEKESKAKSVDFKFLSSRFTMDVIGSCTFGIETNVMANIEGNPFRKMADVMFEYNFIRGLMLVGRAIWPAIFYGLRLRYFPAALERFFNNLLKSVFKSRNYQYSGRHDFIDLMLEMKTNEYITGDSIKSLKTGEVEKISLKVDDNLIVAQTLAFFGAGFETSSSTISYALYELAKYEEAQKRAIEEVDAYLLRHENKLVYECIHELPYLKACVDETLRLYPLLALVTREVVEDYTLPSGVLLEKGMRVHLPLYHLHRKAEYFPEPDKFKPERFYGEEKNNIIPYTYIPFGEGPRICIGMRFAWMSMMAGLITILKSYRVELAQGMPRTLDFEPSSLVTVPRGGIHLRLIPRPGREERLYAS